MTDGEARTVITIKIDTGNEAFQDGNRRGEVARILRTLADKIDNRVGCCPAGVYDTNGNKVGTVALTGRDREL